MDYRSVWFSFFLTNFFENLAVRESDCEKNLNTVKIVGRERWNGPKNLRSRKRWIPTILTTRSILCFMLILDDFYQSDNSLSRSPLIALCAAATLSHISRAAYVLPCWPGQVLPGVSRLQLEESCSSLRTWASFDAIAMADSGSYLEKIN